jgi:Spx/MgsR family transcriptional regulator
MANITMYGIPNCDTIKRARVWFAERDVPVQFHDYKKLGVPEAELTRWVNALGWEPLLNRKGTMWRKLAPDVQAAVVDAHSAMALMIDQSSVIKRPVVTQGKQIIVGFAPDQYAALL